MNPTAEQRKDIRDSIVELVRDHYHYAVNDEPLIIKNHPGLKRAWQFRRLSPEHVVDLNARFRLIRLDGVPTERLLKAIEPLCHPDDYKAAMVLLTLNK